MPSFPGIDNVGAAAGTAASKISPLALGGIALGGIMSLFGGKKTPGAKDLSKQFGVGALSKDTMALYRMLAASPQFRAQLMSNSAMGSRFSNQLAGGLASRGLSTSGIGTVAGAAGSQVISAGETALRGGLFGTAAEGAQQNLLARLQAYTQLQGQGLSQPSPLGMLGSSLLTGGANALF